MLSHPFFEFLIRTFKVVSLFSYQCSSLSFYQAQLWQNIIFYLLCQHLLFLFFSVFCDRFLFYHSYIILSITFWMIRRRRDLNPRTAQTVYTLSRGASSATWVLLHGWFFYQFFCIFFVWRTYYYTHRLCFCQQLFLFFLIFSNFFQGGTEVKSLFPLW